MPTSRGKCPAKRPISERFNVRQRLGDPLIGDATRPRLSHMPSAVDSVFEVAFWLNDRALNDNEYLQPTKLQYLLFLAQAYYAVAYEGKRLVPAIFVADEMGPIEPSTYAAYVRGRPNLIIDTRLDEDTASFVDSIWRRFGHHSTEYLAKLCKRNPAYRLALKRGRRAEIPLDDIRKSFVTAVQKAEAPALTQIVKPKVLRTHDGRPVATAAWKPREVKGK